MRLFDLFRRYGYLMASMRFILRLPSNARRSLDAVRRTAAGRGALAAAAVAVLQVPPPYRLSACRLALVFRHLHCLSLIPPHLRLPS